VNKIRKNSRLGFTLVELLTIVGIVSLLAVVIVLILNPAKLISQGQDGSRISGVGTLDKAISLYYSDALTNPNTLYMGSSSIVYISIPDPTATTTAGTNCAGLGIASSSITYHCAASSTYLKTNGTGWIPINLNNYSGGNIIPSLPVDPINTTTSGEYYIYVTNGSSYELMANPASPKDASDTSDFVKGSNVSLEPTFPVIGGSSGQNIWVADVSNENIQEFNTSGAYSSQISIGGTNGIARNSSGDFYAITPSGSLTGNEIQEYNSSGGNITSFYPGTCTGAPDTYAKAIALDSAGNLYVVNYGGRTGSLGNFVYYDCITKLSSSGTYLSQFSSWGSSGGTLSDPEAIAIDGSGNIWIADTGNYRVEKFNADGTYASLQFGSEGSSYAQFEEPVAIAVDGSGNIWVADDTNDNVQKFTSGGSYITQFGSAGTGNGQFSDPIALAADANGNIWVVDSTLNQTGGRVEEFTNNGIYTGTQFGSPGTGSGQFESPTSIVIQ
jgi:type II secretory pathway pseudopilin PulG